MALDRLQRIAALWNWLPAFRAVAEYESIQRAALATSVSPSALSRTVKQLEDRLGFSVFERLSTGVRLTEKGQQVLDATRDAMRRIDDALAPLDAAMLRVGAVPPFLPALMAPALARFPEVASIANIAAEEVASALLRGDVDVVLAHDPVEVAALETLQLPSVAMVLARPAGNVAESAVVIGTVRDLPSETAATIRADDLGAMLALASARRCSVQLPRPLMPPGFAELRICGALSVCAVWRRAVSAAGNPQLERVLAALTGPLTT